MIPRKDPRLDLDQYRFMFFLIGLVISLGLVIWVLNIKFYDTPQVSENEPRLVKVAEEDLIPITVRQPPRVEQEVLPVVEQFVVVDDKVELEAELDLAITETDEDEVVIWNQPNAESAEGGSPRVITVAQDEEENEEPLHFAAIETAPIFPGCEGELDNESRKKCFQMKIMKHVQSHFQYPEEAIEYNVSGRIILQFVLQKDGRVDEIQILRGVDPLLDQEAIRVTRSLPVMTPARQRGKAVKMLFVMPIQAIAVQES